MGSTFKKQRWVTVGVDMLSAARPGSQDSGEADGLDLMSSVQTWVLVTAFIPRAGCLTLDKLFNL